MKKIPAVILILFAQFLHVSVKAQIPTINLLSSSAPSKGYGFLAGMLKSYHNPHLLIVMDGKIIL